MVANKRDTGETSAVASTKDIDEQRDEFTQMADTVEKLDCCLAPRVVIHFSC
jgi:hypothetical protein